jgi:hypothetical protein
VIPALYGGFFSDSLWIALNVYLAYSDFFNQWNPKPYLFILGLLIEELGWAFGIGFSWPLFMIYVLDGRVVRS